MGACGPPGFYGTIDVHLELEVGEMVLVKWGWGWGRLVDLEQGVGGSLTG